VSRKRSGVVAGAALALLAAGCNLGESAVVYATGGQDIAAGDLDGDGDLDLLSNFGPTGPLMNDGTGRMAQRNPTFQAPHVVQLALGDLDEDGTLDGVALGDNNSSFAPGVYLFRGRGDGSFDPPALVSAEPVVGPRWAEGWDVALADLDDDGHLDLVTVDFLVGLTTRRGDGTGAFGPATSYPVADRLNVNEVLAADLDEDADLDLIVAGDADLPGARAPLIATLANDGTGTLAPPAIETMPGQGDVVRDVAAADLNGDGHLDLVAVEPLTRTVASSLGDGAGAFPSRVVRSTPDRGVVDVGLADLDHDGAVDAAIGIAGSSEGLVLFGDGTGAFPDERVVIKGQGGSSEVLVQDLDADGRADLAFASEGSTSVMMNRLNRPHHH